MPTTYGQSSPNFFRHENNDITVQHNHQNYGYQSEKPAIKGCIAFFTEVLEDKNLNAESRGAIKCAIAEDQTRIEKIEGWESADRKRDEDYARMLEKENKRSKCVII